MAAYHNRLAELLQLTKEINELAKAIRPKMEDNDAEHVEILQSLMEKRQDVIKELDVYVQQADFEWSQEDRKTIAKLEGYNRTLQPLINGLYQSFQGQMNRLNQTKQASKKYVNAYQHKRTDGAFIDQRK